MVTKRDDDDDDRRRRQGEYRAICLWKMDWQSYANLNAGNVFLPLLPNLLSKRVIYSPIESVDCKKFPRKSTPMENCSLCDTQLNRDKDKYNSRDKGRHKDRDKNDNVEDKPNWRNTVRRKVIYKNITRIANAVQFHS